MMSRLHNFELLTAQRGWCVGKVQLAHLPRIAANETSLPTSAAIEGGRLLAKRYSTSFMDSGSQEVNS